MHVAEIGRQLRQKALHIGAVAVPGDEPVNGEAVPIMPISALST
jgi:hypothetical protein